MVNSIIETGVDRLVELVKAKGRISIQDAASQLGISKTTVEEWSDFLEEEGIIKVEYKLTTPYLVERKLTRVQVEKKAKEFKGKKEIFVRKAEMTLGSLDKEAKRLKNVKEEFDKLKKDLGFNIDEVKRELGEIEKYEKLKQKIDEEALRQKKETNERFERLNKEITREQRKYQWILDEVKKEESIIGKGISEAKSIENNEELLKERLNELKLMIAKLEDKVVSGDAVIRNSEGHLERLNLVAESIKKRIEEEKKQVEPLVKRSEEQEQKIADLQREIIKRVLEKEKKLKNTTKIADKFRDFFDKKIKTFMLIDQINKDREELERSLMILIRKAKSFQLSSKAENVEKQVTELEDKFKEIDKKKSFFEEELKNLGSLLKR